MALAGCDTDSPPASGRAHAGRSPRRWSPSSSTRHAERVADPRPHLQGRSRSSRSGSRTRPAALRCSRPIRSAAGRASSARRSRKATARRRRVSIPITPGADEPELAATTSSFNIGFPNAYDRANGRTGALLMVHGDCSSRGCYAMTDEQIGEIYSLARESFIGGQQSFQIQAYPFRMTPANIAKHRNNPNMPFWRMLKEGYDHFEVTQPGAQGRRLRQALRLQRRVPGQFRHPLASTHGIARRIEVSATARRAGPATKSSTTRRSSRNWPGATLRSRRSRRVQTAARTELHCPRSRIRDADGRQRRGTCTLFCRRQAPCRRRPARSRTTVPRSLARQPASAGSRSRAPGDSTASLRLTPAPAHRRVAAASSAICSRREAAAVARSRRSPAAGSSRAAIAGGRGGGTAESKPAARATPIREAAAAPAGARAKPRIEPSVGAAKGRSRSRRRCRAAGDRGVKA